MKKNISDTLLIVLLFLSIAGCKKFITKDVVGQYPESEFYTTQAQALLAITAAYQPLAFTTSNNNRLWVFGDVPSDDAAKGGNPGDQADIEFIDQFNINSTNGNLASKWALLYDGITRCNLVLSKVPPIVMDTNLQTRILAEAKFLRAWYYFELTNIFGDVPIVLVPLDPDELQIAQSPVQQIFETVIEPDLTDAAANLPESYTGADVGRITSGAALALLAKAYLFQSKWDNATTTAAQIVNGNVYDLLTVYSQNFNAAFKNNKESVFEVQHLTGQDPKLGNELNQYFAPQIDGGYYFNAPTQSFVDEFEKTSAGIIDPRLDYSIGRDSMPWFNNRVFDKTWSPSTGYLTRKHQQPLSEVGNKSDGNINYTVIRFSDVLLWYAEALNESGNTADALIPLNRVRKRARESYLYDSLQVGYPSIPVDLLADVTSLNQSDVRRAIQHERRVELGFEFHRYFDMIRWGEDYATQALSDKPNFNYDLHKHFPIPQIERDRIRLCINYSSTVYLLKHFKKIIMTKSILRLKFIGTPLIWTFLLGVVLISCGKDSDPPIPIEKAALQASIDSAQLLNDNTVEGTKPGQYEVNSKAALTAALNASKVVAANASATQAEVNNTTAQLNAAIADYESHYIDEIAAANLIGFWKLNGNANDSSGNDNNGIVSVGHAHYGAGTPTLTADRFARANMAYHFDKGGNIDVPFKASLNPQQMSISLWFKKSTVGRTWAPDGYYMVALNRWNGYKLQLQGSNKIFYTVRHVNPGTDPYYNRDDATASGWSNDVWYHGVVTFKAGEMNFYVNGDLVKSWTDVAEAPVTLTDPINFVIGQDLPTNKYLTVDGDFQVAWGGFWTGDLDDVMFYNIALTGPQVQSIFVNQNTL